jgi:hypothetical protein
VSLLIEYLDGLREQRDGGDGYSGIYDGYCNDNGGVEGDNGGEGDGGGMDRCIGDVDDNAECVGKNNDDDNNNNSYSNDNIDKLIIQENAEFETFSSAAILLTISMYIYRYVYVRICSANY